MDKSRIFIASSGRTLTLAEKLRDELQMDDCAVLSWTYKDRSQPSMTIIEMLKDVGEQSDFAVILLAKDDVLARETEATLEARDDLVFEAGLLMGVVGADRCFLVSDVARGHLPSYLAQVNLIPFKELQDLNDREACTEAIASVASFLKDTVRGLGRSPYHVRVPTLSVAALWELEQLRSKKGDLWQGGEVLVCDSQPTTDEELAIKFRRNLADGIRYTYFLYLSSDTIEKICQLLQVILVAGIISDAQAKDANVLMDTISKKQDRIRAELRDICRYRKLRIALLMDEPQFSFRVHNASNRELARLYVRYGERWFIPWAQGPRAESIWHNLPKYLAHEETDRLFVTLKQFDLDDAKKKFFEDNLDLALGKYFPGIEGEVKQICMGTHS